MKRQSATVLLILGLCAALFTGCAHTNAPTPEQVEQQGQQLEALSQSKLVLVVKEPYLGVRSTPRPPDEDPAFAAKVTLRRKGTLAELCAAVSSLTGLSVQVSEEGDGGKPGQTAQDPTSLEGLLSLPPEGTPRGKVLAVSHEGSLKGLLDQLSTVSGYGWDAHGGTIVFSRVQTRTFTIYSAPGKVGYSNQLTNKSKETSTSSGFGGGVNQTVSTADTSTQTAQTNSVNWSYDVWKEAVAGIKALLSPQGTVTASEAAGTVTVRDSAARMHQVGTYVAELNTRFNRQVALKVQVWSLDLNDDSEAGLNLETVFTDTNVSVVAGSLAELGDVGSASVALLSGKFKDSKSVLRALNQWGNTSVVTSGSGIVMSNTPFPVQAIRRHGYLAAVSTTTNSEYGQTAQLTPGEVTTGFAMTVIPHILDKRRVILQYNANLSNLDALLEYSTADVKIQLPKVSTRSFSQRMTMKMGQTLVLAGFQQESQQVDNALGIFSGGRKAGYGKTLLLISISVESAEV